MAEPKKRLTSARSGKRRSHIKLEVKNLSKCPKCKSPVLPHRICVNCGYYRGEDLLRIEERTKAKEERRKARQAEEDEALKKYKEKK